jgi:hypothetical protein
MAGNDHEKVLNATGDDPQVDCHGVRKKETEMSFTPEARRPIPNLDRWRKAGGAAT